MILEPFALAQEHKLATPSLVVRDPPNEMHVATKRRQLQTSAVSRAVTLKVLVEHSLPTGRCWFDRVTKSS